MSLLTSDTIDNIIDALNFNDENAEKLEDAHLRTCINYAHVLDVEKTRILEMDSALNLGDLCYSSYYWFTQYKNRYFELFGHDEGLEQQAYKMLENISVSLENINWSIIEQIDNGVVKLV